MNTLTHTALVTAAAQGIGAATAQRLAAMGMNLVLVDVSGPQLHETAEALRKDGAKVCEAVADVTDCGAIDDAIDLALETFQRIDVLANIAGGGGARNVQHIDEIAIDEWDHIVGLNLRSTFLWCRAVVPHMRRHQYGRIVNMSSTIARGRHGPAGSAGARLAYASAKAGILGFTAQLAKDVGRHGITVNAVLPWLTLSAANSRVRQRYEALDAQVRENLLALSPMGRPGTAEEVAAAIAFLASPEASFISGTGLPVDGAYL